MLKDVSIHFALALGADRGVAGDLGHNAATCQL